MLYNGLLDLYNKEKEKNAKLERDLKHKNELIKQADKDLEREYVHIEELENADLTTVYINGFYDGEKKCKDKIREKIEEIKMTSSQINGDYFMKNYQIEVLQELLEE